VFSCFFFCSAEEVILTLLFAFSSFCFDFCFPIFEALELLRDVKRYENRKQKRREREDSEKI
jgi:hypothetical protein